MSVEEGDVLPMVEGDLVKISEPRSGFSKKTKKRFVVASATFRSPETGDIELALWGTDTEKFRAGDKVVIKQATVSKFQDKLQLSVGKKSEGGSISLK